MSFYVMELKVNGTAQEALDQIRANGYATPYLSDGRRVVSVGIHFDNKRRNISEWKVG